MKNIFRAASKSKKKRRGEELSKTVIDLFFYSCWLLPSFVRSLEKKEGSSLSLSSLFYVRTVKYWESPRNSNKMNGKHRRRYRRRRRYRHRRRLLRRRHFKKTNYFTAMSVHLERKNPLYCASTQIVLCIKTRV